MTIQKISSNQLQSHSKRLNNVSNEIESFGRRLEIIIYELITRKKCNYKWDDNLKRYFNQIEPTIVSSVNNKDKGLTKLMKIRSELISAYHLFQDDYFNTLECIGE